MASSVEEPATVPTWIREQAELGNPKALKELGYAYDLGKFGLKVDYDKAFECWEKAAAKKNKNAICCLGDCYKHGHGVERDVAKAFKLCKRSSKNGLYLCIQRPRRVRRLWRGSVSQNKRKAFKLYKKAAEHGYTPAMRNHAIMLKEHGGHENKAEAARV